MKALTSTIAAASCTASNAWGFWLRKQRELLGLSQEAFAWEIVCRVREGLNREPASLAILHIHSIKACKGCELSRFENGVRLPAHRHTHLLLLWVLLRLGAAIRVQEANAWLESGSQGWLTAREASVLFTF